MKVIFNINGKEKEVDASAINSEADLKKVMIEVASSKDESVTQVLDNVANFEKLMNESKAAREKELQEKRDRGAALYERFFSCYNLYVEFRKTHNITAATEYDSLPNGVQISMNILENSLAFAWHPIKTEKFHTFIFAEYPQLKPFCKRLELTYKQIKSKKI